VTVILENHSYNVTWEPPEYGHDQLGLYIIRWFLEPEHKLHGSAETRNNFYTGEPSLKPRAAQNLISLFHLPLAAAAAAARRSPRGEFRRWRAVQLSSVIRVDLQL
jgi:hypothetical protein